MPLVPDSLVDAWYDRDSAVYKSFAYLFQNPLWTKEVPQGFSLCPLFWLAVVSFLVLRPLVYVTLGLRRVVEVTRLTWPVRFTDSLVRRAIRNDEIPFGLATVLGLMLLALAALIVVGAYQIVASYAAAGVLSALFLPIALLGTLIGCGIYSERYGNEGRCPVEVYVRTVAAVSVALAAFLHPTYAYHSFVEVPRQFVADMWWLLSYSGAAIWHHVVSAFSYLFHAGIASIPYIALYGVVLLIIAAYGWFLGRVDNVRRSVAPRAALTRRELRGRLWFIGGYLSNDYSYSTQFWYDNIGRIPEAVALARSVSDVDQIHSSDIVAIKPAVDRWLAEYEAAIARRDARCKATTAALTRLFTPVIAVWNQCRIFASYLWQLVKARKQGACPYKRFYN